MNISQSKDYDFVKRVCGILLRAVYLSAGKDTLTWAQEKPTEK